MKLPLASYQTRNGLTLDGLQISPQAMDELLGVNSEDWETTSPTPKQFFDKFGNRLPTSCAKKHEKLSRRLSTEMPPWPAPASRRNLAA